MHCHSCPQTVRGRRICCAIAQPFERVRHCPSVCLTLFYSSIYCCGHQVLLLVMEKVGLLHDEAKSQSSVEGYDQSTMQSRDEQNKYVDTNSSEQQQQVYTVENFHTNVKYGLKKQVVQILEAHREFVDMFDENGFSAVHWAAKRGDVEMLETLYSYGAPLSVPTLGDAKMYPVHWAASDGKIAAIHFFLEKRQDINVQDANGCTPIAVAVQHKHITCVIFLFKNGADLLICDVNGDNPLHWAAYKGHLDLVGFLSKSMKHSIENVDNYGQTALHLGVLRGHYEVVEYLASVCQSDVTRKDRNGHTPLDLAISKQKLKVEMLLRKFIYPGYISFVKSIGSKRLFDLRILTAVLFGSNDKELSYWMWRVVFMSNFIGSVLTMYFIMNEHLSDLYLLHLMNTSLQLLWWFFFLMCLFKSPGRVHDLGDEYSKALDLMCNVQVNDRNLPIVCHSCGVRRPLRSKHCKIQGRCIHKFDHFCPFVGNTVGRDNYKYFIGLLVMHTICGTLWEITACHLAQRVTISWSFLLFMLYSAMWMLMIVGLLNYHTTLILNNLTTNEQINVFKYPYLQNAYGVPDSPFRRKTVFENVLDALFPSKKHYYSREEVIKDEQKKTLGH